ncbi:hypothetical protein JAAARDRAFT_644481 [Jaapia argillacea MUCL 33604]|uniref:DUF6697 domain-containing protein n=1 Tax=Jaapia argillacea MUCL 33604 TaxID=933084 RepID=A0A067PED2_9AGAM|nr:hypothetical protein JAAARDRAFT_644481 [Jaapia argillacea MUCL 33604]
MVKLPIIADRPRQDDLLPCFPRSNMSPATHLTQQMNALCTSDGFIFAPDLTVWCLPAPGDATPPQHALLIEPHYEYRYFAEQKGCSWNERNTNFQRFAGNTRELFFRAKGGMIHYAGTYKCLSLSRLSGEEYRRLPLGVQKYLLSKVLTTKLSTPLLAASLIQDSFEKGVILPLCLGLQCVGFNHELYRLMLNVQKGSVPKKSAPVPIAIPANGSKGVPNPNKRKSSEQGGSNKKAKAT